MMHIVRRFVTPVIVVAVLLSASRPTAGQDVSAEQVRQRIERAKQFLLSKQGRDGSWPEIFNSQHPQGVTSLVTLALLNAGVSPNHPKLKKSIQRIVALERERLSTYVASLRIMVLAAADPKAKLYRVEIQSDADWLVSHQLVRGATLGGWNYPGGAHRLADSSNTQFAMLALHEAKRLGARIDDEVWVRSLSYWQQMFDPRTGGFSYRVPTVQTRGSMTCAGISSLLIAEENLANVEGALDGDEVVCCQPNASSEMIDRALKWMEKHFSVRGNPVPGSQPKLSTKLYYLYGMERVGRLSGRRFFGTHDWYREGANHLLKTQTMPTGSWVINESMTGEGDANIATALALLFLSKGKRPVAIGKLKTGVGDDWNRHPQGVHYLTRELETQWKTKLNWQTIDGTQTTVDVNDWAQAPVLFISGRDQLDFSASQKRALKEYIENGNFVFAEACMGNGCGQDVVFDKRFRGLMAELFPDTQLEPLAASHPIWNAHFELEPNGKWPILGLQACCRTSVVYVPKSLSGHWRLNREAVIQQLPTRAREDVEYAKKAGVNVVSYATGRQLRDKLDLPKIDNRARSVLSQRALVLPKLTHRGGFDDAPNAWRNILRRASELGLTIDLEKKIIAPKPLELMDHPFVFVHGQSRLRFTDQERKALAKFLEGGHRGFLFVDSICSSEAFNRDFAFELGKILPGQKLVPIPPDHPIWTDQYGGFDLRTVTITRPDRNQKTGHIQRKASPQFKGIEIDGRLVVVFSPYDLSCAMENATVSNCEGYIRSDAVRLALNVLLYRLHAD